MAGRVWSYRTVARDQFQITAAGELRAEVLFQSGEFGHAAIPEFVEALAELHGEPVADPRTATVSVVVPADVRPALDRVLDLLIALERHPDDIGAWMRLELAAGRQCARILDDATEGSAA
jgi:hypothetical protein